MRIDFEMPPVRGLFPSQIHPAIAELEQHLNAWVRRYGLTPTTTSFERYRRARFHELVARGFPRLRDLTMIGEWYNFLWFWDDQLDDGPALVDLGQLRLVIEDLIAMLPADPTDKPTPPNRLGAAIADLWARMAPPMSAAWRRRFSACAHAYLDSYATPLAAQRDVPAPSMETYIEFRRISGAMETVYPLLRGRDRTRDPGPSAGQSHLPRVTRRNQRRHHLDQRYRPCPKGTRPRLDDQYRCGASGKRWRLAVGRRPYRRDDLRSA